MTRKEYLIRQKNKGRHLFGVFPAQYPREILWAMNAVPVEIWDPPLEIMAANAHLQPYICSVVKLGLELILQGKCSDLDGFLFPHTCDSIQNLATIVNDYLGLKKTCYFFYHPKAPYRDSSRIFYMEQLEGLASRLEKQLGPLDLSKLKQRVGQGQRVAFLLRELYDIRARGGLSASNAKFYRVIRKGEFLLPDDFIPLLEEFLAASKGRSDRGPAVILSGVLPNPSELLTLLDERGVRVADDDLLGCGRRLLMPPSEAEDPFEAMVESYFAMPPCTTKGSSTDERLDYLHKKIEDSGAKGVIFLTVKFCEPELFDVPQLIKELKKKGLATLVIDSELNQGLSGQLTTRVEAFVEMIS
ncbi:MAG: 2-hydroxyacyl-CoA dehydratase [Desulfobacteraceae bacterium]|nr:MAG: 2-hydroxyacyl-CoA dehydratase [Desulfobacteraceae bacterium]